MNILNNSIDDKTRVLAPIFIPDLQTNELQSRDRKTATSRRVGG